MNALPRLIIRADAGYGHGLGHVLRCLALAQAWVRGEGEVVFAGRISSKDLQNRLLAAGCFVHAFQASYPDPTDASTLCALVAESPADSWVMVDGYHFDETYLASVKEAGARILLVDDLAGRDRYTADILLNHGMAATEMGYPDQDGPRLLLGPSYRLLREEFLEARSAGRKVPARPARVLVTMGGEDSKNSTLLVLEALQRWATGADNGGQVQLDVVIGPANRHHGALARWAEERGADTVHLLQDPDMSALMMSADMAICAGGGTLWELIFFGVPSLVIVTADNQEREAACLHDAGVSRVLGKVEELDAAGVAKACGRIAGDAKGRGALIRKGMHLVDGQGPDRIVQAMLGERIL